MWYKQLIPRELNYTVANTELNFITFIEVFVLAYTLNHKRLHISEYIYIHILFKIVDNNLKFKRFGRFS